MIKRLFALRFGPPGSEIERYLASATNAELDVVAERLLTAGTAEDALGKPAP